MTYGLIAITFIELTFSSISIAFLILRHIIPGVELALAVIASICVKDQNLIGEPPPDTYNDQLN